MKKILLLFAICTAAGRLMAQQTTVITLDDRLKGKLIEPFKYDTLLSKSPSNLYNDNLLKQPADINKLLTNKNQYTAAIVADTYKMPIAKLNGKSKMPVLVLHGNSKMPVAGYHPDKEKKTTEVVEVP